MADPNLTWTYNFQFLEPAHSPWSSSDESTLPQGRVDTSDKNYLAQGYI